MTDAGLTILNLYELNGTAEAFREAVARLAVRVEAEGHRGIASYRFFVDEDRYTGRAVIDYTDAAAWLGHHDIAMGWPEMTDLHHAATLVEIIFLGNVTPAILAWIRGSTLKARIRLGGGFAAGFRRAL
jgi:hypothetical protein